LEVLSAKTAKYMLYLNAIAFIATFFTDLSILLQGFKQQSVRQPTNVCTTCNSTSNVYYENRTWYDVHHIVTFRADVSQTNFTSLVGWSEGSIPGVCTPVSLSYDLELWSCGKSNGCGDSFSNADSNEYSIDKWLYVYSESSAPIDTDMCALRTAGHFTHTLIPNFYQYQVSHPLSLTFSLSHSLSHSLTHSLINIFLFI
jgi:hypothetical protein